MSKAPFNIREMIASDLPSLRSVIDANKLFPSELLDDMTAIYFQGKTEDQIWLTVEDGQPIALAYCAPEPMTEGTWNLLLIAVHPDRHSQGHGTMLMHKVEQELAHRHARLLLVETSGLPGFERTRSFYRKLAYRQEARIQDFYRDGEDKIVFWKSLRPNS